MQFRVKVLGSTMQVDELTVDAASESEARQLVASAGGQVIALHTVSSGWSGRGRHHAFNLSVFNQQLHSLLDAGQTVVDAIDVLGRNDRQPRNRAIYQALLRELRQGNQLSDAMASLPSVFSTLYVAMVRSSETTGTIRAAISRYMQYQRQVDEIRGKLTAAATYPAILLSVGLLVIAFLMLYVLPRFSAVYEDTGSRNGEAGFVQWWGAFVRDHELFAWGGMVVLLAGIVTCVTHPVVRRALYQRLLASPWIGERIQILQYARLYRTLGMLLQSGVSILAAMRMTRSSLPEIMHTDLDRAVKLVSEGIPISAALNDCHLATEVAVRLLVAGESSGTLDDMMCRVADFYDQETALWIDMAGRLIEPIMMLAIGLVVGGIVLMLYSPIFDLANIV